MFHSKCEVAILISEHGLSKKLMMAMAMEMMTLIPATHDDDDEEKDISSMSTNKRA